METGKEREEEEEVKDYCYSLPPASIGVDPEEEIGEGRVGA